jgi:hypothetical protein
MNPGFIQSVDDDAVFIIGMTDDLTTFGFNVVLFE